MPPRNLQRWLFLGLVTVLGFIGIVTFYLVPDQWLFIVLGLIAIFIGLAATFEVSQSREWRKLATSLSLQAVQKDPHQGSLRKHYVHRTSSGRNHELAVRSGATKNGYFYAAVELFLKNADPGFFLQVRRERAPTRLAKALGSEDITTGDPEFDRRFFVTASDPLRAQLVLNAETRKSLEALMDCFDQIQVRAFPHVKERDPSQASHPPVSKPSLRQLVKSPIRNPQAWAAWGLEIVPVLSCTRTGWTLSADELTPLVPRMEQVGETLERFVPPSKT